MRPLLLLAFANDPDRYLHHLAPEARGVRERLEAAVSAGLCDMVIRTNATADEILDVFQDPRYRDRIAIFHFAGHASAYTLLLESAAQGVGPAHSGGFAAFLASQGGLKLVFLNGCSTEPQVERLLLAGVPAVIATTESIADDVASAMSIRFYAGLAGGASIETSYEEAVAAVRTTRGDQPRDVLLNANVPGDVWPWGMHVRDGAESVRAWNLPSAAGDPLYGLPRPPERDLPDTPYRNLQWFREEDAAIFFGRAREIRTLYQQVTAPSASPILLFYGESGVGKSSMLAAGLLPRLVATHQVRYARRDKETGLSGSLAMTLDRRAATLADAWKAAEEATGKPLTVILDQVEEVFTRPGKPGEFERFLDDLDQLFANRSLRPRGRIVLAFRKEWLAEIEALLRARNLPRSKFFLDRLDRTGIIEIVEGPARVERLRAHFRLQVELDLAAVIADDVLEDPNAAIAPTLEVLLTKLFSQAVARNPDSPSFVREHYQALRRKGVLLDDFVEEQLETLHASHPVAADSGLVLDLLAFHTTPVGTAEHRTNTEITHTYGPETTGVEKLLRRTMDLQLLAPHTNRLEDGSTVAGSRLAHDTLAPLVRRRFDESDRPGQRARRILESRAVDWEEQRTGSSLDESDLATVEAGRTGMRAWTTAETRLVEASRARRRNLRLARRALVAAGIAAIGLIGWQTLTARAREAESRSRALAVAATTEPQTDLALLLAIEAVHADPTYEASSAVLAALLRPPLRLLRTLTPGFRVFDVAFHPDSSILAAAVDDGTVRLWDVINRMPLAVLPTGQEHGVTTVAFSPDGSTLVSGSFDGTLQLWDVGTRQPIVSLAGHAREVRSIAYSPDGSLIASGDGEGRVRLWTTTTYNVFGEPLDGHDRPVELLTFSSDGTLLASSDGDGVLMLWDADTDTPAGGPAQDYQHGVSYLEFSGDDRSLLSIGSDRVARLWSVPALRLENERSLGSGDFVTAVALLRGGPLPLRALGTLEGEIDVGVGLDDVLLSTAAHSGSVTDVAFNIDGSMLASGGIDGTLRLWGMTETSPVEAVGDGGIKSMALSPDGSWAVAGYAGGRIRVWSTAAEQSIDLDPGRTADSENSLEAAITAVTFSEDGGRVATGSYGGTVRVWDATTLPAAGEPVEWSDTAGVTSLGFHPDGRLLAVGGADGVVRLRDVVTGRAEGEVVRNDERARISSVVFDRDGKLLVVDYVVWRWDVDAGRPVGDPTSGGSFLSGLAISPDGRQVATAGENGELRLRDSATLEPVGDPFIGHAANVYGVAFSPDGARLASGDQTGTIRLWDVSSRRPIGGPIQLAGGSVRSIAFSPDGAQLFAAAEYGPLIVWDTRTNAWVGRACRNAGRNLPADLWARLMPSRRYRCTCPALPPGEGVDAALCEAT